jgi:leader peptidase (prepilin peptidase)/N-methyltransferase
LLGGRCRFCKKRISLRYIIVELLTAGAFVLLVNTLGLKITTLIYMLLCSGMIVATFVDFEYQEIPDEISYGGMIMGLILSPIFPQLHSLTSRSKAFYISLAGLITGGLIIYGIGAIGKLIFKKDAMGGGDVKFLAMIGTFLGPRNAVLIFFVAPFFGSIVGVFMKLRYKAEVIPYGPYLSLASATVILWGDRILKTVFPYL